MPRFSVIIPVYNRSDEIHELLQSLKEQTFSDFEILVIEDGSTKTCKHIVEKYEDTLSVQYFFKENSGQGFSRNYGFERAKGDYLIVFDSDCLIPNHYFETVQNYLIENPLDAFGGPDRAHSSFTPVQKAINYSMTSFLTTGGIRGGKRRVGAFHPRSFNMGISREVYEKTGGYLLPKKGEDIEFSIRIIRMGFKTGLIPEAYVYHKRRTNFLQFYRQLHFFGTARVNVNRFFPGELKLVHLFPSMFLLGAIASVLLLPLYPVISRLLLAAYGFYSAVLVLHAFWCTRNLNVAVLSLFAAYIQLFAYGHGLLQEWILARKPNLAVK